jgi:hypothetical protein
MPFGFKKSYAGDLTTDTLATDGVPAQTMGTDGQVQITDGTGGSIATGQSFHYTDTSGIISTLLVGNSDTSSTFTLKGVDATASGGGTAIELICGNGFGEGGEMTLQSGDSIGVNQNGGPIAIITGAATGNGDGGEINISAFSGGPTSGSTGGAVNINSGNAGGVDSNGGNLQLEAGGGGATSGDAGGIFVESGNCAGSGSGGDLILAAGTSASGSGSGADGQLSLVQSGRTFLWPTTAPSVNDALICTAINSSTFTLAWQAN